MDTLTGIENLTGSGFNDTLTGDNGNNILNGGVGLDKAIYSGVASAYTITRNGGVTISGAEGTDTLTSIERIQFSDRTVTLNHLGATMAAMGKATFCGVTTTVKWASGR